MAVSWSALRQELSCPVCRDIFTDPVLLPCSHSLCNVCIVEWWRTKGVRQCPVCKTVSSSRPPPRNLVLKNLCEAFQLEVDSGLMCSLHTEKFKLYCEDHRLPVCVVCRYSREHAGHRLTPVDEAAQVHRNAFLASLAPLREKAKLFRDMKVNCEQLHKVIRSQTQETERTIREEFQVLREFLQTEEEVRVAALKEEGGRKRNMMKGKIAGLTREINALESTIKDLEGGLADDDLCFLKKVSTLATEAQRPLPDDPQQVTGALIDVAKYLGNMRWNVWCKMKEIVSYTPVILNPNTAHQDLHIDQCLTNVRSGSTQTLPSIPERIEQHRCVLGFDGYSSGSHSWDVEVGDNHVWALGVVATDAQRMGDIVSGLWMLRFCNGKFTAFSPSRPVSVLQLKDRPQRIRVQLDLNRGKLVFSNQDCDTVIHTFTHIFTGRLFPYFNTWNNVPLRILPRKLSLMVTPL
uniref:Tripartite motif containing 35-12 n=2 Tax=Anabas testudineus TaxID=64144 RepID=A0A3Q1IIB4_ANATE